MSDSTYTCMSGEDMYREAWNMVRTRFFDQSRLADWDEWEHRFDGKINSVPDAIDCIVEMLGSLNDPYTGLIDDFDQPDQRSATTSTPMAAARMLDDSVGYLRIRTFAPESIARAVKSELRKLSHAQAYIVDLRGNPGGLFAHADQTLALFMDQGMIHVVLRRDPALGEVELVSEITETGIEHQLAQSLRDGAHTSSMRMSNELGSKPVVLLADDTTASAAELFVGAMRDNKRAITVGARTAAKGIGQGTYPLANGCSIQITDTRWLTPSREFLGDCGQTVSNGIVPDVVVAQDDSDRDVQLDSALSVAHEMLGAES